MISPVNTFFGLANHAIQSGAYDPSAIATFGRAGSIFIQVHDAAGAGSFALWQKQDDGTTTNWTVVSGGSGTDQLDWKDPVDTIDDGSNINLAAPGAVINGVTMAAGMSFIATNQTLPEENGIYDWNGAASAATRRSDADTDAKVTHGMFTWVAGNDGNSPTVNNLTGWVLSTPNPIVLDTTPLTFVEIPIPAAVSSRIDGLYFVAENGDDSLGNGSIAAPFATIQAAINQAVADGHGFASQAEVLVLPSSAGYAGFTSANGVHVKGLHGDRSGVRITSTVTLTPDASGLSTNLVEMSNLLFQPAAGRAIDLPIGAGDSGQFVFRNCTVNQLGGSPAVVLNESGSETHFDNCEILGGSQIGLYVVSGFAEVYNGTVIESDVVAVNVGAAASVLLKDSTVIGDISDFAVDVSGTANIINCRILGTGVGNASAIAVRTGATCRALNCELQAEGPGFNYLVEVGSTFRKSNLSFVGSSILVSQLGVVDVVRNSEELTVEEHTITAPEAAAEAFDLAKIPLPPGQVGLSIGGVAQAFGPDFTITGGGYTVSWAGLGMAAIPPAAGDVVIVTYQGSPR